MAWMEEEEGGWNSDDGVCNVGLSRLHNMLCMNHTNFGGACRGYEPNPEGADHSFLYF